MQHGSRHAAWRDLHNFFWPFTILTASHIKQCVPHSALPTGTTPFKLWFHCHPNLSHLQPFRIKCTACIITDHHSKFQPCGKAGRFLGYANDAKGYLVWVQNPDANGGTLKIQRDIIFHNSPDVTPSPPIPNIYHPLWKDIDFPGHLNPCNEPENPYMCVHTWKTTNCELKTMYSQLSIRCRAPRAF